MAERDYMATRLFTDRDSAEREYEAARARGYDPKDINVVMTEEGRKRHFAHGPRLSSATRASKAPGSAAGLAP